MSSSDDDFEQLKFPPPNYFVSTALPKQYESADLSVARSPAISDIDFKQMLDSDGRLLDEHHFRQSVFKGGIQTSIRKDVWKFLFGYFGCHTTIREREVLTLEQNARYNSLKHRWKNELQRYMEHCPDSCDFSETLSSPNDSSTADRSITVKHTEQSFLSLQAEVYAGRQPFNVGKVAENVRSINKDVPRTIRSHPYYKGDGNIHLHMLRNILVTFAAYHDDVGYAQGMNDIASRFLVVMDSEPEAYWCFSNFVEKIQVEFLEEGMAKKLDLLRCLLGEIDEDLFTYLNECQVQDLAFCHRWLLVCFLREFEFEEGLRMFEMLSSHYLEMNSLEAQKAREYSRQKNSEFEGRSLAVFEVPEDSQLTFILFVCVAVLMENRAELFACSDAVSVFQCVSSMTKKMTVDQIMAKAESLFYAYCQKSVVESFQVIECPSPKSIRKKY